MEPSQLIAYLLKQSPKALGVIAIITFAILLLPVGWADAMGLVQWRTKHHEVLGLVSVATAAILFVHAIAWASAQISHVLARHSPRFHLTPIGGRQVWGVVAQKDGSTITFVMSDLMAKNLRAVPTQLIRVRLVKPHIRGEVVAGGAIQARGGDYPVLAPESAEPCFAFLDIRGSPKQRDGDLAAVLAVSDDEGHEERVKLILRHMSKLGTPKKADPTTSAPAQDSAITSERHA